MMFLSLRNWSVPSSHGPCNPWVQRGWGAGGEGGMAREFHSQESSLLYPRMLLPLCAAECLLMAVRYCSMKSWFTDKGGLSEVLNSSKLIADPNRPN